MIFEKYIEVMTKRAVELAKIIYITQVELGEQVELDELIPVFHKLDIDNMFFYIEFRDKRYVHSDEIGISVDLVVEEESFNKAISEFWKDHKSTVERLAKEREEQSRELKENKERKERAEYERLKKKFGG
ncbi:MAG: hypothetical protein CL489_08560 [Acidobacteria bacterium]|nr:hypothetical protein [Acidobacteriota bacterium]|tara:strand:- start:41605 stop:41994 length:390 start_codon:yes stop_codon:yes gene_type:complete